MQIKSKEIKLVDLDSLIINPKNNNQHSEKWKIVENTSYAISSKGKLYNLKTKKFKKATTTKDGYLTFGIFSNGKNKTTQAHRLVAKYFVENYQKNLVVNHRDFNRKNNCCENLEMCTPKENVRHSSIRGRYTKTGENNSNCKYSDKTVEHIRLMIKKVENCAEISRIIGIPRKYINDIKLGKIRGYSHGN